MKKLNSFIIILVIVVGLMLFPHSGSARMKALTEDELSEVTGHGGILGLVDQLGLDLSIDTLYYGDEDGVGGSTQAGYISFCDVILKGCAEWSSPASIDIQTSRGTDGATEIQSINMSMSDMTLKIDQFNIDAIRLGSAPGIGNSLGSIGISDMTVNMTGNIRISAF